MLLFFRFGTMLRHLFTPNAIGLFLTFASLTVKAQCPGSNTGYMNGTVGTVIAVPGNEVWNNSSNALTDNNSYATISNAALLIGGTIRTSNFLVIRKLGMNLPTNAQVCGVQVEIRKSTSDNNSSNYTRDLDIRLLKDNQIVGTNHANAGVNWPTTETAFTYGTNADSWGTTLTGFDVNKNGFGVAIQIQSRAAGLLLPTVISYIDAVRIRVYYYVPNVDIDGDGTADWLDTDMDGDGLPNSKELILCNTPSTLILSNGTDASLISPKTADVDMAIFNRPTSAAGVTTFSIAETYAAVTGSEINTVQDVTTGSDYSTIALKFNKPVYNLRFKLQDIDLGAGQYQDHITVNAYDNNQIYSLTSVNYSVGSGNFNEYSGNNVFLGLTAMSDNEMNGTIGIHIPDMVDSVQIIYRNADLTNLGPQSFGLGEISYCNAYGSLQDFDGDGLPGFRDADADGDGIPDLKEIQASVGFISPAGADTDNDGLDNAFDASTGGVALVAVDTDGDGIPDYLDLDSDGDEHPDQIEGNDPNRNCVAKYALTGLDTDGDGLDNSYDINNGGEEAPLQDTDGNGIPDFRQNTVPTLSQAGSDQSGLSETFNLNANTPENGRGYWSAVLGTGTFADENDPATAVTDLITGTNTYAWTIYTDGCHYSQSTVSVTKETTLPVTMSGLSVRAEGKIAVLKWSTFTEQNNKGFGVLRSTDGRTWAQIQFIPSLGNSGNSAGTLHYNAQDLSPAPGINYYRISQQDIDGVETYSTIRSLLFNQENTPVIYPNPVRSQIVLPHSDGQPIKTIKLLDTTGKVIFMSEEASLMHIDVNGKDAGLYFLQVSYQNGAVKSYKVVKQ